MAKIPYLYKNQDLTNLDTDAPFGKLPRIIDTDNGTKIADLNTIIEYLRKKHNIKLNNCLSASGYAVGVAFDRLACEHLYWGGVNQPRWRMDEGWEGAEVSPELQAALDAFRVRILAGFDGQGMGRRDAETALAFYQTDIDALADFLGNKMFFLGDTPRAFGAGIYAMLKHLVKQPQKWKGSEYTESKKNLAGYLDRFGEMYKI